MQIKPTQNSVSAAEAAAAQIGSREPVFLGVPKDENEWIKYEGRCTIFSGAKPTTCDDPDFAWELVPDEQTKRDLAAALSKVGVRCVSIRIVDASMWDGTKQCIVSCSYNKPYEVHNSEFFLEGLSGDPYSKGPLEFYFDKRVYG